MVIGTFHFQRVGHNILHARPFINIVMFTQNKSLALSINILTEMAIFAHKISYLYMKAYISLIFMLQIEIDECKCSFAASRLRTDFTS